MNRFVRDLWPEDQLPLFDTIETAVQYSMNTATQLVTGNPQRIGLILAAPVTIGNAASVSINNVVPSGKGINFTPTTPTINLIGPGYESLAAQPWFVLNPAGAGVITTYEVILSRPAQRPPMPAVRVVSEPGQAGDYIRRILAKHAKWRQRVLRELERRKSSGQHVRITGARLAAAEPANLRQSQSNLRQLRQSPRFFARPPINGHGG